MNLVLVDLSFLTPNLIWGIFLRLLGVVYFIAIAQLFHQVLPIAGARGMSPVKQQLCQIREDFPSWKRFFYFPTLLWVNASDWFLKTLIVAGSCSALAVIYGGAYSQIALFLCWAIYLSLDIAIGLFYPWDSLLLETGFLALLLPPLNSLPDLAIASVPLPSVAFAYQFLIFRLMFGFGKTKFRFRRASLRDVGYIKGFMVNIPLPTYLGWYAFRLPRWIFLIALWGMFLVEIPIPLLVFVPGDYRVIAAVAIAALMIGIQLTGNFGFFNILTIVLCVTLLDRDSSVFSQSIIGLIYPWEHLLINAIALVLFMGGLLHLPFNSWCTQTWMYWPSLLHIRNPLLKLILNIYRIITRFRILHSYGIFPPKSSPALRWIPVIEGTEDGKIWKEYHYNFMTTTETTPPRFVAPYHPRLDHEIFYEGCSTLSSFVSSLIGAGNPYIFSHRTRLECLLQRLLEGEPSVNAFFRTNPFPPSGSPPIAVRINLFMFQPTTYAERLQTGRWWRRTFVATHTPATQLNNKVWQQRLPNAENFHWDAVIWKQRSPQVNALINIAKTGAINSVLVAASKGLTEDSHAFWNFVANLAHEKKDWKHLQNVVNQVKESYTWDQLRAFETILVRLSIMLSARLEPYFFARQEPRIIANSYFHLGLLIHHIIGKGESVYTSVLKNPLEAIKHSEDFTLDTGLFYLGIFWFDTLVFQARQFRLVQKITVLRSRRGLPGFFELVPFISQYFQEIGEERFPALKRLSNGEWKVSDIEEGDGNKELISSPKI